LIKFESLFSLSADFNSKDMFLIVSKHDKKKAPMKGALMDEGYLIFDP